MVAGNERAVVAADLAASVAEALEGLRRSDFVDDVSVDVLWKKAG